MVKGICPDGMTYVKGKTVAYKTSEYRPRASGSYKSTESFVMEKVDPVCISKKQVPNLLFWMVETIVQQASLIFGLKVKDTDWDSSASELYRRTKPGKEPSKDASPVRDLSYAAARAYCSMLGYRLPTEGEWANAYYQGLFSPVKKEIKGELISEYVDSGDLKMVGSVDYRGKNDSLKFWKNPDYVLDPYNHRFRCVAKPKRATPRQ